MLGALARRSLAPLGLAIVPVVAALAALAAPHLAVRESVALFVAFALATSSAFASLALASSGPAPRTRSVVAADALAVAVLAAVALGHSYSLGLALAVGAALVALAWGIGTPIGRRVQHPGHLLPACIVAAAADIVSVFSPHGPTHAIVESERALSVLALPFPIPGTRDVAPTLGAGDLVFVALLLGAAATHGLSRARVALLAFLGAFAAVVGSALLGAAVPALPTIGLAVLAGVPRARALPTRDRTVATIAIAAAITVAGATLASRWLETGAAQ